MYVNRRDSGGGCGNECLKFAPICPLPRRARQRPQRGRAGEGVDGISSISDGWFVYSSAFRDEVVSYIFLVVEQVEREKRTINTHDYGAICFTPAPPPLRTLARPAREGASFTATSPPAPAATVAHRRGAHNRRRSCRLSAGGHNAAPPPPAPST